jgi:hypothetical protein
VAEVIVARALMPDWRRPAHDWAPFDLESGETKLEVKQSARQQTWQAPNRKAPPRFDIAPRAGWYDKDGKWHVGRGRVAHLYVLALHEWPLDEVDQRDPAQWQFLVIPASCLPADQKSIGWSAALRLAPWSVVRWNGLAQAVAQCQEAVMA